MSASSAGAVPAREAPRIVLDTNVCLDLLLFDDPRALPLADALASRQVVALANADTRTEWTRVLGYPALRLTPQRSLALVAAFDALTDIYPVVGSPEATDGARTGLPRCSDPDDQKFLQLAHAAGARWLLSRDQDLLTLAARCRRHGGFSVLTPQAWAQEFVPPG